MAESQRDIEKFFRRSIKKGQQAGEIPTSLSSSKAAKSLLAALLGLLVLSRSCRDRNLLKSVADGAMAILT